VPLVFEPPGTCPRGHDLGPHRVLVGWQPCLCHVRETGRLGHMTYDCDQCRSDGKPLILYDPPCDNDPLSGSLPPG
jgi:hypothetical protein